MRKYPSQIILSTKKAYSATLFLKGIKMTLKRKTSLKHSRIPAAQPVVTSLPAAHTPKVEDVQLPPKKLTKRNHHEPRPAPETPKVIKRRSVQPRIVPPPPEPPNPHVLELQGQIIKLVNMREALQAREAEATDTAAVAQAQLQSARSSLQRVESEVNYRIDLIAKLTGKTIQANYSQAIDFSGVLAGPGDVQSMPIYNPPVPISGIGSMGSIPASRPMVGGGPEGNVRMESAEAVRNSL
jgi:hypothetical protein